MISKHRCKSEPVNGGQSTDLEVFNDIFAFVRDSTRCDNWISHNLKADFATEDVRHIALLKRKHPY